MKILGIVLLFSSLFMLLACSSEAIPVPKPRSFPRVLYPERIPSQFSPLDCPFTFRFPDYGQVEQKELYFDEAPTHPCWFDLYLPDFDGRLHFSYYPINGREDWETRRDQAFELVGFHNKRASNIVEYRIDRAGKLGGMAFEVNGPAASPYQFFLTDSTQHFVRAALYFNTKSRPDSMRPIVQYVVADIQQLIDDFQWKVE